MTRRLLLAGAVVAWGLPATAPPAHADEQVFATPPNRYASDDRRDRPGRGGHVHQRGHGRARRGRAPKGADGKPLFASPLVAAGRSAPVDGTQYLTTGDYAFFCTLHPQMGGTLRVGSAGKPVPRPGTGTSPGTGPGGSGGDTKAPSVRLALRDKRLSQVARRGALRVSVTVDEAATVRLVLRAGGTTLGGATAKPAKAGTHRVSLKLTKAGARRVRQARRLRLSLSATARDGAGNAATQRKTRTLR